MMQNKITKKTKLIQMLKKDKKAAELLFNEGLSCLGCPMSMEETIEQGCKAHGFSDKQIDELIKKINTKK